MKQSASYNVAGAAEYLVPFKARTLLFREVPVESEAAVTKFRTAMGSLPLVLKGPNLSDEAHRQQVRAIKDSLCSEIPRYLPEAIGIDAKADLVEFWSVRAEVLPNFYKLFLTVGTLQAASAAAERYLSLYQESFGNRNTVDANEDYMEACLFAHDEARES